MAEGRSRAAWAHTSALLCLTANVHRDPKRTRPFKVSDFDPHARRRRRPPDVEQLTREILMVAKAKAKLGGRSAAGSARPHTTGSGPKGGGHG